MGTRWNDGYVVDAPYTEGVTVELSPAWFSMVLVLHGQPPLGVNPARPLIWAELGSGSGVSACMVAAANPNVEVWGCDFNPTHVERARALASAAAITNCAFDEATFAEVAADERLGPPAVDVVIVHGVYSWISTDNQQHIAEFIRRRLRPGGLAYLSYEVPTGWSSMVPIAEALRLHVEVDGRRSDVAFSDAAAALLRVRDGGARFFPLGPHEVGQFDALATTIGRYGAHEYLGEHFRPLMFDQVADAMSEARCAYVGSIEATDQLRRMWVPPELTDLVTSTPDGRLQQMLRDLTTQRALRRDLFRRGLAAVTTVEDETRVLDLTVIGLGEPFVAGATAKVPVGEVGLDEAFYRPLVEHLASDTLSVADIMTMRSEVSLPDAAAALAFLVSGGYAAPVRLHDDDPTTRAASRRLNRVLIDENRRGGDHSALIAPATGAAIGSEYVEMLCLGALWDGSPADAEVLAEHALSELADQRRQIREDGRLVEDPAESRVIALRRAERALDRFAGVFVRLGISEPATPALPTEQ